MGALSDPERSVHTTFMPKTGTFAPVGRSWQRSADWRKIAAKSQEMRKPVV